MDTPRRGALMLVCFTAACLMGISVLEVGLNWAEYKFRQVPFKITLAVLWGILFLAGVVVLIKARAIADWISDKLE